jgi:hypothetical protein
MPRPNLLTTLSAGGYDVSFYSRDLACSAGIVHCLPYYNAGGVRMARRVVEAAAAVLVPPLLLNRVAPQISAHAKIVDGQMLSALGRESVAPAATASVFHLLLSHSPYVLSADGQVVPTENYGFWQFANAAGTLERYRQQLQYVDRQFGAFRDGLKASGTWDTSVVVVTSDHGTCWTATCMGRLNVTEVEPSLVRIPMMIRAPSLSPRISDVDYQHIDFLQTVADALGIEPSLIPSVDGHSALRAPEEGRSRVFFIGGRCAAIPVPARRVAFEKNCATLSHRDGVLTTN